MKALEEIVGGGSDSGGARVYVEGEPVQETLRLLLLRFPRERFGILCFLRDRLI